MFTIYDSSDRAIAFSGRQLPGGAEPKYRNSPATEIYKKDQTLYENLPQQAKMFGWDVGEPAPIDETFNDSDVIRFGKHLVLDWPAESAQHTRLNVHRSSLDGSGALRRPFRPLSECRLLPRLPN